MEDLDAIKFIMGNPFKDAPDYASAELLYITDMNGGSYADGNIQFQTTGTAASNQWVNFGKGFLHVPFQVEVKGTQQPGDAGGAPNDGPCSATQFDVAVKAFSLSIINSVQVVFQQKNVTGGQPLQNVVSHFNLSTALSEQKLKHYAPEIMYCPDSLPGAAGNVWKADGTFHCSNTIVDRNSGAFQFFDNMSNPAPTAAAVGNIIAANGVTIATTRPSVLVSKETDLMNHGFVQRALWASNNCLQTNSGGVAAQRAGDTQWPRATDNGTDTLKNSLRLNNCTRDTTTARNDTAATVRYPVIGTYNLYLIIPMQWLHSFFENLPILKGADMWITLNVNQIRDCTVYPSATANNAGVMYEVDGVFAALQSGRSAPIQVSNWLCNQHPATTNTLQAGYLSSITAKIPNSDAANSMRPRLYYWSLTWKPEVLQKLTFPERKRISYLDYQVFTLENQSPANSVNWQITNSITGVRKVVIYAYAKRMNASFNYTTNTATAATGGHALLSLTSGEPYHSSFTLMQNVVFFVEGRPMHNLQQQYPVETFMQDMKTQFVNENSDNVIVSGTWGWNDFQKGVTPLILDLTKMKDAQQLNFNPVALQLQCDLRQPVASKGLAANANFLVDLYAFVMYERVMVYDQDSGSVTVVNE